MGMGAQSITKGDEDALHCPSFSHVDPFLCDALQNPRQRLTILRMEQQVERFMQNPYQQQLDFEPLPTSYLRLIAHRVAQHYGLQSMVVADFQCVDGSGYRIIAHKTAQTRYPTARLADIPSSIREEEKSDIKFEIKQRNKNNAHMGDDGYDMFDLKLKLVKSVEERKEEYLRARARIFDSSNSTADSTGSSIEDKQVYSYNSWCSSSGTANPEGETNKDQLENNDLKASSDTCSANATDTNCNELRESPGRIKASNSKVAIFRDLEKDRKDPDFDRNSERYSQHYDQCHGLNFGSQPLYTPLVNYNFEFSQLSQPPLTHFAEEQQSPAINHVHGQWVSPVSTVYYNSSSVSIPRPFSAGQMAPDNPSLYLQPSLSCFGPTMPYSHAQQEFQPQLVQNLPLQYSDPGFGQIQWF